MVSQTTEHCLSLSVAQTATSPYPQTHASLMVETTLAPLGRNDIVRFNCKIGMSGSSILGVDNAYVGA